ncbi:MAG TPA: heterodisulfide reductase-related iron-sulfur binding cluster [Trueperaceae bacterium]|nr:heterodisulfide reductase-related iron-sulfur binding cluster [Trueperaceae bacterium]
MLSTPEKLVFLVLALLSLYYAYVGFARVVRVIRRGGPSSYPRLDRLPERAGRAVVRWLSQRTVFKRRPLTSAFHAFIFYGFVLYLFVNLIDLLNGYLPRAWTAGLRFGAVGDAYRLLADVLTVLILVGMIYMLVRRFWARDRRLQHNERTLLHDKVRVGSVQRDSLIVGAFILLHVGFRLFGETFLLASEGRPDAFQPVASTLASWVGFGAGRVWGWHLGWWAALGLILAFLPYFPRSKHLHLIASAFNFAVERRAPDGRPVSTGALEPIDFEDESLEQYGAASLEHLRYPQLLDAYACIQCNRCADVCPANQTGKALSPAALEINKRYELNEVARGFAGGEASPRPLMAFALSEEALWACTTCGACMEVCPVGCEQMIDIVDIRRDRVMMEGAFPSELQTAFRGMERMGNPWGIGEDKRMDWAEGLAVPTVDEKPDFEVLFWVGCAGAFDPAAQKTTRAMVRILEQAGVSYAVLGKGEKCTGDPARRAGNEYLYYQLAAENVAVLNETLASEALSPGSEKLVLTTCPHCFNALFNDYPQLGGDYRVVHHTQLIERLMAEGRLPPVRLGEAVTYHDPCYLGRHNGVYDAPRAVLSSGGGEVAEMPRHRENALCCGAGGAQFWKEEEPGRTRVSEMRFAEAEATGAAVVAAACPFCKSMLSSSESASREGAPEVRDVAQLVADELDRMQAQLEGAGGGATASG